jgi:plastocyanin
MLLAPLPWLRLRTRLLPANTEVEVVTVPVAVMAARAQVLPWVCLLLPPPQPMLPPRPPTPQASTALAPRAGTTAVMTAAFNVGFLPSMHQHRLIRPMTECVVQFGPPSSASMPPPSEMTASSGSSGPGATHTVWVAPTQGVLRYVPFALNASVGDTVKFIWGANKHTVTKSSELSLCNKTGDAPFTSGVQNQTFVCKNNKTIFSARHEN